ncbi:TetR/AcrR family transcriptional regulator [Thalassobius sp. Cn5-15]|uniref:TetR/AcrR family transcriptional regulator n=1 Tax=Thalassobius sp. Cn5-15 TaxID=2917763 RepID=UPI001EF1DD06|nr:TetR/AcrR family transcriptional regulator [Thalassobius sp. Cn5-15]MCG7493976.1 TetR/AcrR family transcriptional regulator [Thalassobius sp. Cn5-15]
MTKQERTKKIEAAAYKVLEAKGFKGASMLAIAREAKASNETLYAWYGDKIGLFSAMIKSNAQRVESDLLKAKGNGKAGLAALLHVGGSLLAMVTSEHAIALNRAAAGDVTGELGRALGQEGRNKVLPILVDLLKEAYGEEQDVTEHLECFLSLLLGDLQIRRAIGTVEILSSAEIKLRSERAIERLQLIFAPPNGPILNLQTP